jgi:hypothetical protein
MESPEMFKNWYKMSNRPSPGQNFARHHPAACAKAFDIVKSEQPGILVPDWSD